MDLDQQFPEYIIILMEDDLLHTAANGYNCGDPSCPCNGGSDEVDTPTVVEGSLTYVVDESHRLN